MVDDQGALAHDALDVAAVGQNSQSLAGSLTRDVVLFGQLLFAGQQIAHAVLAFINVTSQVVVDAFKLSHLVPLCNRFESTLCEME